MPDLLATKLYIPRRRHSSVARPRLIQRLKAGLDHKLTLITAPAGFGKTTLLSEWIAQSDRRVTWVSLDDGDNDPARFWSYFIAALQLLDKKIGMDSLALLQSPQPSSAEAILTILLNEIAAYPEPFVLILDDYQFIQTQTIQTAIKYFLEHMPSHMHLVIASRTDPPLPLARLRVQDQLKEIRSADLRFTSDETSAFLNQTMGLNISTEHIISLEEHTEGWVAGLQLAGLALQDRGPQQNASLVSEFIQAFTGSHRYIVSYLVEEVLSQRAEETMDFLLQTSILDHLSGPLCDYVLELAGDESGNHGRPEHKSQPILEQLVHDNLFIVPLDEEGKWFRYHHLFVEVLRHQLIQNFPERMAVLHLRASEWYEQSGLIPEAVKHAFKAEEWERAARLLEQIVEAAALTGQVQTVFGWLNNLPGAVIRTHPTLCLYQATMLMFTNHLQDAEGWLQAAELCIHPGMPLKQADSIRGWAALVRADIARVTGDLSNGVALALQALDLLPENEALARAVAKLNLAHGYLATGRVTQAEEREAAASILPVRSIGNRFATLISITNLARLQAQQGKLHQAADTFTLAEQVPGGGRMQELLNSASYYFGYGDVLREWNQLEAAQRYLELGMDLVQGTLSIDADVITAGYVSLAKLKQEQGDPDSSIRVLGEFGRLASERKFFSPLIARGEAVQAQILLWQGSLTAAVRWMEESRLHITDEDLPYQHEVEYLTMARVRIAQNRADEAVRLLGRLLHFAETGERKDSTIKILALQALAFYAQGESAQAFTVLERSLSLAEPEGYIRVFVDEGEPMRELLQENRAKMDGLAGDYAGRLLDAFPDTQLMKHDPTVPRSLSLTEPLSDRELGVLRLIADGASNREISNHLVIAHPTVKRHISNIFNKLGVGSRTQAVAAGRKMGLL